MKSDTFSLKASTKQGLGAPHSVVSSLVSLSAALVFSLSANAADLDYNGPPVTFEQIYANPSNNELNLQYARQQAAKGDLISALAALERMLYAQQDWDSARLFYALVLYKLDDKQAALRELDYLEGRPLSPEQRVQANAYRDEFKVEGVKEITASGFSGRAILGARYDNNAGSVLTDAVLANNKQSDFAALAQGALRYIAEINDTGDLRFNANISGQSLRHESFSNSDYDALGGRLGLTKDIDAWTLDLSGEGALVYISGGKYLTQFGPRLTIANQLSEATDIWLSGTFADQDYEDLNNTAGEALRSGNKYAVSAGVDHRINTSTRVAGTALYENKEAENPNFAYEGFRIGASILHDYDNGLYTKARASYRHLNYDAISRSDDHISARLAFGASIANIRSMLGTSRGTMDSLYLEIGADYIDRGSNIDSFEFENFGSEIRLIWDF